MNWEEPAENKEAFLVRGNNPLIEQYPELVAKTFNKEERNRHLVVFEDIIVFFLHSLESHHSTSLPNLAKSQD